MSWGTDRRAAPSALQRYAEYRNQPLLSGLHRFTARPQAAGLLGCMLGLAVGDVLGCPIEGMAYRDIQKTYGRIGRLVQSPSGSHWRLSGLHSDDTQQALVVLQAYIDVQRAHGRSGPQAVANDLARRVADLYVAGAGQRTASGFGCWRGTGSNFRAAVQQLSRDHGSRSYPFGAGQPSAGLGAAMRVPPLGLLADTEQDICAWVTAVTHVTHTDPLAITSACATALAARFLAEAGGAPPEVFAFLERLHHQVSALEMQADRADAPGAQAAHSQGAPPDMMSQLIAWVADVFRGEPGPAMRALQQTTRQMLGKDLHPTAGYGPSGVAACLYFLCASLDDPEKALLTTLNAGGDTDTTGAIVGAWAGALHGPGAFARFLPQVLGLDLVLNKVSEALQPGGDESVDLLAAEAALSAIEEAAKAETPDRRW